MGKKTDGSKSREQSKRVSFKKVVYRKLLRRLIPTVSGIAFVFSMAFLFVISELNVISISAPAGILMFLIVPIMLAVIIGIVTSINAAEYTREHFDDVNDTVQRLAMGHYERIKRNRSKDEFDPIYNGLGEVAGRLTEKDSRIESIGRKCDQLEGAYEGETCRWMSARVNPEMMKTVLCGIETMAQEGRCEDILNVISDANEVIAASLEDSVALRPLADELSRIKRFLEIYEAVYQYKIIYRMSIMCNIVNYRIIPNLVLPAVQILFDRARAIGLEDYELSVEVNSSFTNLLVIIRDNNGLSSEVEFSYIINDDAASRVSEDGAISIGALNRRISSFYGKKYSIKLSTNKLGTAVYIYLPPVSSDTAAVKKQHFS